VPLHERAAEDAREMAAELRFEARAGAPTIELHEPLDSCAVLEEARCSASIARVSRGGGFHVACIGDSPRSGNPWRE